MTFASRLGTLSRRLDIGPTRAADRPCACDPTFHDPAGSAAARDAELHVDASDCPGDGDLVESPDCRATVVEALTDRDVGVVRTRTGGIERTYTDGAAALLVAAGRFVERAAHHDSRLAARATRDPLDAAHEATGRAGSLARIVAETGLALGAERATDESDGNGGNGEYRRVLRAFVAPTVARCLVAVAPPADATLVQTRELDSGARVRLYDVDRRGARPPHRSPVRARRRAGRPESRGRPRPIGGVRRRSRRHRRRRGPSRGGRRSGPERDGDG